MSKRLYHVDVYRITRKAIIVILATSQEEAEALAFDDRYKLEYSSSDCNYLAIGREI